MVEELKKEIINELIPLIPKAVSEIDKPHNDKVCFIALYRDDYDPLVSLIQLGLVKYRQECFESSGFSFNSGEQPAKYQSDLTDEKLKEKEKLLISMLNPDDYYGEWWKQTEQIMFEVSMRLNEYEWNEMLDITDDFIVFVDWEAWEGDLSVSVPKGKIENLIKKGLYDEKFIKKRDD
ncbi:hypothetical protein [Paenibacillus sp. V4I5]|uniref:hypothetical protein n=1 Tax=Paenibacillus sp. V4I5 TaxID=3042306 RepID=UPI0027933CCC|nr:hypothetical protein [Paenibacillus sp. V4I5]MDQ0913876.1 hypothetical protein [Paenibacillus sp. V4I5]